MKKTNENEFDFRKINSFEAACKHQNFEPVLPDVSMIPVQFQKALIGVYRIMVVCAALKNKVKLDYANPNQPKWFPWFRFLSSGFRFLDSDYGYVNSGTSVGSRLSVDSEPKCEHLAQVCESDYNVFMNETE